MSDHPHAPLPDVNDPAMAPFWSALRDGKVVVQECQNCGHQRWPALPSCPDCWSAEAQWAEVEAAGTLWSYVIYHRALSRAFEDEVPYAIGMVELAGGPRITARLRVPFEAIHIGMRCQATFKQASKDVVLLEWDEKVGAAG